MIVVKYNLATRILLIISGLSLLYKSLNRIIINNNSTKVQNTMQLTAFTFSSIHSGCEGVKCQSFSYRLLFLLLPLHLHGRAHSLRVCKAVHSVTTADDEFSGNFLFCLCRCMYPSSKRLIWQ